MAKPAVEGVAALRKALRKYTEEGVAEMAKALDRSGAEIAATAQMLAPKDTGELAGSIRHELLGGASKFAGRRRVGTEESEGVSVAVMAGEHGGAGWYAPFVEFGTAPGRKGTRNAKGRKVLRDHPGTAPRPFLFPAYRLLKARSVRRLRTAMNKAAKLAAQAGRRNA